MGPALQSRWGVGEVTAGLGALSGAVVMPGALIMLAPGDSAGLFWIWVERALSPFPSH